MYTTGEPDLPFTVEITEDDGYKTKLRFGNDIYYLKKLECGCCEDYVKFVKPLNS